MTNAEERVRFLEKVIRQEVEALKKLDGHTVADQAELGRIIERLQGVVGLPPEAEVRELLEELRAQKDLDVPSQYILQDCQQVLKWLPLGEDHPFVFQPLARIRNFLRNRL